MISIIVYGRNDNYGYHLHKRAAISLNCLAEVLGDPDDELIFVDYNSPNELPTFPEAIADTLTSRARARLRILRVRPEVHARYAAQTHLVALEPVARNVAVRRSNPVNRWILSTNTDDILVLRQAPDLTSLAGDLPPGLYHTARFEIPETLWESFDRADPPRTIGELRALGRSARLNEVVRSDAPVLFDGPGDFQLVHRAGLFEIDGFDERMLRGWHVDANLAKRMSLKYGAVRSLLDHVYCYHCDHTRQVTAAHRRDAVGNDHTQFVDGVARPDLPEQRQSWGCAGDAVEEIGLVANGAGEYRRVLQKLVEPLEREFSEIDFTSATYGRGLYDPQHVLPFLADLLNYLPRDTQLAWCGRRADMFALVRQLWNELGFRRPIAVNRATASGLLAADTGGVEIDDDSNWLAKADLFGFEFGDIEDGSAPDAIEPRQEELLASVQSIFLAAVAHEHARQASSPTALPRLFIGIDCIHNRIERLFTAHIAAAITPFGPRLRHGYVTVETRKLDLTDAVGSLVAQALGRDQPIARKELDFAKQVFSPLLKGEPLTELDKHRAACHATLGRAWLAATALSEGAAAGSEAAQVAIALLDTLRPSTTLRARLGVPLREDGAVRPNRRPLSRFAGFDDWDDPAWSAFVDQVVADPDEAHGYRRDAAHWEQIHLLYGLSRAGVLSQESKVLIVATMPDPIIAALSRRLRAELFGLAPGAPTDNTAEARVFWSAAAAYRPDGLSVLPGGTRVEELVDGSYDAVVFPHGSIFGAGLEGALAWLQAAERLLRPNGILAFKAEIAACPCPHSDYFDVRALADDGLAAALADWTAYRVTDGFDGVLSRSTVDKLWPEDGPIAGERYFLSRQQGRILIPSYWFLTKQAAAPSADWARLRQWLMARWNGELSGALQVGAAGRREGEWIVSTPQQRGHVFFGPYLAAPDGLYRVTLRLARRALTSEKFARATLEAVFDGAIIARARLHRASWVNGIATLDFTLQRTSHDGPPSGLEIRLYSPGGLRVAVAGVDLELREFHGTASWPRLPPVAGRSQVGQAIPAMTVLEPPPVDRVVAERRDVNPSALAAPLSVSRIAHDRDWDDPRWLRLLDPYSQEGRRTTERRDRGEWERAQLLSGLDQCGVLNTRQRILVVATMPDEIIGLLSEYAGHVDVLDLAGSSHRRGADARLYWSNGALYARARLAVCDPATGLDDLDRASYQAIVFPHSSLFLAGTTGIARLLSKAEQALAPGGLISFTAEMLSGTFPDVDHLDAALLGADGLSSRIAAATGFGFEGSLDPQSWTEPEMARHLRGRVAVPSVWFFRKRAETPADGWDRVQQWLLRRLLGEQISRLELGPVGRRESGCILTEGSAKGITFFGPYVALPSGRYQATLALRHSGTNPGRLRLEVVAGADRFHAKTVRLHHAAELTVNLPFDVPPPRGDMLAKVEIRAGRESGEVVFSSCRLDELD